MSLSQMAQLLEFTDETELKKRFLDQPGNFHFKISGIMLKIESMDIVVDIERLAASFEDWKKNEKNGNGKKI